MSELTLLVGIMGTSSELLEPLSELWEKWEMSHRNYGKIFVGIMGRNRWNCGP
jgi:hypothetical protein